MKFLTKFNKVEKHLPVKTFWRAPFELAYFIFSLMHAESGALI